MWRDEDKKLARAQVLPKKQTSDSSGIEGTYSGSSSTPDFQNFFMTLLLSLIPTSEPCLGYMLKYLAFFMVSNDNYSSALLRDSKIFSSALVLGDLIFCHFCISFSLGS